MTAICAQLLVVLVSIVVTSEAFRPSRWIPSSTRSVRLSSSNGNDNFDGKDFEDALKKMGGVWNNGFANDEGTLNKIREQQEKAAEEIYRKYPFEETMLPVLPDCNNYYSGKFGDYFWHQNADQVYVYIPIDDDVTKKDIDVKFEALSVDVKVKGEDVIEFKCLERIIPDGSFWVFEEDKNGKKYLQLDLEKRFRMINWKGLFGEPQADDAKALDDRTEMLKKLFSANKGMSKITGQEPESVDDMMSNEELVKMISSKIYGDPEITESFEDIPDDDETIPGVIDTTAEESK